MGFDHRVVSHVGAVFLLGVMTGCQAGDAPVASAASVQDSLGVRVVTYSGELPTAPIDVSLEWEHGHGPEDYTFQFVFLGAAVDDAGNAVVGDSGNREVVHIAGGGAEFSLLAATGEGPSEVGRPRAIVAGEEGRMWVEDPSNGKILEFEGGEFVGSVNTSLDPAVAFGAMPIAEIADGELLMMTASFPSQFEEEWLDGYVTRLLVDDLTLDTIGAYPMAQRWSHERMNPFSHGGLAVGWAGGWAHARTDLAELTWRDLRGGVTQIVRWTPTLEYPTDSLWGAFQTQMREDLARVNPRMSPERAETFADEQLARYSMDASAPLPLFGMIKGSRGGDIWLPAYEGRSQWTRHFTVLGADGLGGGVVTFERPVQVLAVTDRHVLTLIRDEFDVQGVAVYSYVKEW